MTPRNVDYLRVYISAELLKGPQRDAPGTRLYIVRFVLVLSQLCRLCPRFVPGLSRLCPSFAPALSQLSLNFIPALSQPLFQSLLCHSIASPSRWTKYCFILAFVSANILSQPLFRPLLSRPLSKPWPQPLFCPRLCPRYCCPILCPSHCPSYCFVPAFAPSAVLPGALMAPPATKIPPNYSS